MSLTVSLKGFVPVARYDGISWQKAIVEEASAATGPWAQIDEIGLSPDPHPERPEPRNITTHNAALDEGYYRVRFKDAEGFISAPSAAVRRLLAGSLRPSVAEVAAYLRARTKVRGGNEEGTFTEATRPTEDEVDTLITEAEAEVLGKIKNPEGVVDANEKVAYEGRARSTIALYAAILVELSYYPEQVRSDQSPVSTYEKLYNSRIAALTAEGIAGEPGTVLTGDEGGSGEVTIPPADAAWSFPAGTDGLVGWRSVW